MEVNHNLSRCEFIFFALLLLLGWGCSQPSQTTINSPPNIVLILADDMGYSDIGCYGSEIQTPNLDYLAENGIRFNRFHNAARCCPTRASLLTGLYPHQAGMGSMVVQSGQTRPDGPYQGYLRKDSCGTIAELLKQTGYQCYMSGKWHVGEYAENWPVKRGFDQYWGLISGASSYFEIIKNQRNERVMALNDERWEPPDSGFYMTDYTSQTAVNQIRQHQENQTESPFFLYVAFTAPHWPLHALPEDIAKYKGKYDIGWDSLRRARYQKMQQIGLFDQIPILSNRPASVPPWIEIEDKQTWSRKMEVYAAMIDRMDQGIGKIIQQLNESQQLDNTLIIFLSDNGACAENISGRQLNDPDIPIGERGSYVAYREPWAFASNTPFRYYKQWTHEGGTLTPFIMHWPKADLPKGEIISQRAHIIDILPTLLSLSGTSYPQNLISLPGINLLPLIKSGETTKRTLYWEHFGKKAIIAEPWKLVQGNNDQWELYNIMEDATEMNDLVQKFPDKVESLKKDFQLWANKVGVN